jgi:DNA-binding transcriptional LysR family regulator
VASAYDWLPLGAMRMFEAGPSHLSFAVATQAANVTHATVSQQIKTLEAYAQAPLFRRTGRGWRSPRRASSYFCRSARNWIDLVGSGFELRIVTRVLLQCSKIRITYSELNQCRHFHQNKEGA